MADELFEIDFWLSRAAVATPLLLTLIVGIAICYRQRQRRPHVARLIGWALLAEFVWLTVGSSLLLLILSSFDAMKFSEPANGGEVSWIMRTIIYSLPGSIIQAAVWGTILWAVLQVDDWNEASRATSVSNAVSHAQEP